MISSMWLLRIFLNAFKGFFFLIALGMMSLLLLGGYSALIMQIFNMSGIILPGTTTAGFLSVGLVILACTLTGFMMTWFERRFKE